VDGKLHQDRDRQAHGQPRLAGGVIRSSFFAATDASDIPDSVSMQMADIFQGELDFRRGLRKGDRLCRGL
jgi:hypothetical protein